MVVNAKIGAPELKAEMKNDSRVLNSKVIVMTFFKKAAVKNGANARGGSKSREKMRGRRQAFLLHQLHI